MPRVWIVNSNFVTLKRRMEKNDMNFCNLMFFISGTKKKKTLFKLPNKIFTVYGDGTLAKKELFVSGLLEVRTSYNSHVERVHFVQNEVNFDTFT